MNSLSRSLQLARILMLVLMTAALFGPWVFDIIHVPAEYPCQAPWVRIGGDFCGLPHIGIASLNFLLILPVLAGFASARSGQQTGWVALYILLLGAALLFLGTSALLGDPRFAWRVWGPWVFFAAASAALLVEVILLVKSSPPALASD
jgi:hypothetical protein